ncbi:thiamine phosphate synthase [Lawsonia intracellularis]|uniref:Thiamine-phosphate synthase n=1 Tax=Lawsonia intracellularis (strain PHE/MN1-00) TaxID=363253 RepID=THIE_LAWIP|nr:thiamine phosphate synthase [Lawsonia intracellularis]Q1MRJ6.1 RecName: Full=Thiamine-phosphate synthase; Short=TP synthase; Short=TPS; AltName: Full=Thiamine-phosphate pyrophosphorylase; Short=TMP pyrophosphorylase; Short=TMP-PPase [Lawsonia intracellularis PHE/MN1-00]AGC49736.1 thiamine monophosphate synthase [Lawsonia intracellularis N343]MBZ3892228.1 thiamine phosphate synthase [Lawsonia intracellularis]RBN32211.1 thiamine phosphate synthase [Lawsonia intracellularis]CAJ54380.1 Thiamine
MAYILPGSSLDADLYAITDDALSFNRSVIEVVKQLLDAGIRIIQYREKNKSSNSMLKDCITIKKLTEEANACFIVNDHVDIAVLCNADGVHLGQDDLPVDKVRELIGKEKIIGLSTHSPQQAQKAIEMGADYIGVGPLYPTKTKKDVCEPVTISYLDWVVSHIAIPFVAIGGIKQHNIQEVIQHGAKCCALVSEILSAPNIPLRIQELRQAILLAHT